MNTYEIDDAREWRLDGAGLSQPVEPDTDDEEDEEDLPYQGTHSSFAGTPEAPRVNEVKLKPRLPLPSLDPLPIRQNSAPRPISAKRGRLDFESDNQAKAAWRSKKPPNGLYKLPEEYHKAALSITTSFKNLSSIVISSLDEIGTRTGAHIQPPRSLRDRDLHIWGDAAQVRAACYALDEWINHSEHSTPAVVARKAMPSVHPITTKEKKRYEAQLLERTQKDLFRQTPEKGSDFAVTGAYIWCLDEKPSKVFGSSYEALDPIRMFHGCYIIYDESVSAFKVLANAVVHVEGAIKSIANLLCEYATRKSAVLEKYLVSPPDLNSVTAAVEVIDAPFSERSSSERVEKLPRLTGENLTQHELEDWQTYSTSLAQSNRKLMQQAIVRQILRLRYFRGRIQMRAHMGIFALNNFRWLPNDYPSLPLKMFIENMNMPGTRGTLHQVRAIGQESHEMIVRTREAVHLFEPVDAQTPALVDVIPSHSALFSFGPNNGKQIRLQIETSPVFGIYGVHEVTHRKWFETNLEIGPPLQIFNIRLQGGISWKLQIATENNVETSRLTPSMSDFANSIRCEVHNTTLSSANPPKAIFVFNATPGLRDFVQKTVWKYRLRAHGSYVFEIARYDSFHVGDRRLLNTVWGGSIHNESWDQMLCANATMRSGVVASWPPLQEVFFPPRIQPNIGEAGFADFLMTLQSIVNFLNNESSQ